MRPMTSLQAHTLGIVLDHGPVPASEVSRHLLCSQSSAYSALQGLERRNYVGAVYTGHRYRGRAYGITDQGTEAYAAEFGEDE